MKLMIANSSGSTTSVKKITAKSTPIPTNVVIMPDLISILRTPSAVRITVKSASAMTEKLVRITSATIPKKTSARVEPSETVSIERSCSDSTSTAVSKPSPSTVVDWSPLSSLSRRAVARPKA